jgi:hypothetical protein
MIRNSVVPLVASVLLFFGTLHPDKPTSVDEQESPTKQASAATTAQVAHPVLVELFTSEGCSSCPPADEMLKRMDGFQPAPDTQLIVLSEHVDYWDHDGWKDPYSSHLMTERQSAYVHQIGLSTAYTPQLIVDGTTELRQDQAEKADKTLQAAATTAKVPVRIKSLNVSGSPAVMQAQVEADGSSATHDGDVYVAIALDHADTQVLRGENSGKHLSHVAVVENLTKIGKLKKGQTFSQDVQMKLNPGVAPNNLRVIAFVQESGPGKVLGVALRKAE